MKSSGRCDDAAANGWTWIKDEAMCERALVVLGYESHSSRIGSFTSRAPAATLLVRTTYSKILKFNTAESLT